VERWSSDTGRAWASTAISAAVIALRGDAPGPTTFWLRDYGVVFDVLSLGAFGMSLLASAVVLLPPVRQRLGRATKTSADVAVAAMLLGLLVTVIHHVVAAIDWMEGPNPFDR
jgi:hypothetical protein